MACLLLWFLCSRSALYVESDQKHLFDTKTLKSQFLNPQTLVYIIPSVLSFIKKATTLQEKKNYQLSHPALYRGAADSKKFSHKELTIVFHPTQHNFK